MAEECALCGYDPETINKDAKFYMLSRGGAVGLGMLVNPFVGAAAIAVMAAEAMKSTIDSPGKGAPTCGACGRPLPKKKR